jgi:hypothetical protein
MQELMRHRAVTSHVMWIICKQAVAYGTGRDQCWKDKDDDDEGM